MSVLEPFSGRFVTTDDLLSGLVLRTCKIVPLEWAIHKHRAPEAGARSGGRSGGRRACDRHSLHPDNRNYCWENPSRVYNSTGPA